MTLGLEKERPVVSKSSKPDPEQSKGKPKGPQKKQRVPRNNQGKGKAKANLHRPYPQGYRIPKLEPSAKDSVFNMARTHMELTAKKQERMNSTVPYKEKPLTWFLKQQDRLSSLHPYMSDSMINIKILRKCGQKLENSIKCRFVGQC
ncbi:hypothetical protein O181_054558 [Austropuccinia psidii MF-1]|uniref:Uncharacterized protein n=1 Tax=Austropuccinia psidii MF-1 TaxID=1389203 RepID=A0A9Q3E9J4_9BASI|nr:hypothetical protein [Austropuccinia psidii MF-1]